MGIRNDTPKYKIIVDEIVSKIELGTYTADDKIPSENVLAKQFDVSVPTVRRALLDLVHMNKVVRIKGKGTFVKGSMGSMMAKKNGEQSQSVGFLLPPHHYDASLLKMLRGVQRPLHEAGYSLNVLCSYDSIHSEVELIQRCFYDNTAGLILFSNAPDLHRDTLRRLEEKGIPVVLLDRGYADFPCNLVSSYNKSGSYNITTHLIRSGHRKIAFVSSNNGLQPVIDRIEGYRLALHDHGIPYDENMVVREYADDPQSIAALMARVNPTAIQCTNDNTAISVMQILENTGRQIPADVSVAGFDGIDSSRVLMKKLTTAVQQFEKMGEMAAKLIVSQIAAPIGYSQVFLPAVLEINQTTRDISPEK